MHDIPHAVLSERIQEYMKGRRLKSAVFLTFRFEPDFFEQEILPAVLPDLALSQVSPIRAIQLEDALAKDIQHVAVYYDRAGLVAGEQSAKLDVRRVPITHPTGYFHPKNVLLLTESIEPLDDGRRPESLIVAAMSANLTRRGCWENVEVCHIEALDDGDRCGFRADLLDLIRRVKAASPKETPQEALESIRAFVLRLQQRQQRTTDGVFHPRLYTGGKTVADFLEETHDEALHGLCLEVVSPYFDKADAGPLRTLCERFEPREVRVYLPRGDDGAALVEDAVYAAVRGLENVRWAQLPADFLRAGRNEREKRRYVHAKVYRFFHPAKRFEAFLVGSVNLTTPAHSTGGNFETAFVVETQPRRVPDWWLEVDAKKPLRFQHDDREDAASATTQLSVRYDWASAEGAAYWDASSPSGTLAIGAQGAPLFELPSLPPRAWVPLSTDASAALGRILSSTSFLSVSQNGGPPATILVQEEGMVQKPSLLHTLTAADILRYWALLTPEQRAAFLEEHGATMAEALVELGRDVARLAQTQSSIFDSFAGIYHAFNTLERFVIDALESGRAKAAEHRLLGKKYDSLPNLLDKVMKQDSEQDVVNGYVIVLCARQLVREIARRFPEFHDDRRAQLRQLESRITGAERIRERFTFGTPEERAEFLGWFDQWFLRRAEPIGGAA